MKMPCRYRKSQINIGILKWLVRVLGFMGMSFFSLAGGRSGEHRNERRAKNQSPVATVFMFAVPVLLASASRYGGIYHDQSGSISAICVSWRRAKPCRATESGSPLCQGSGVLAWGGFFVEPGTYLPTDQPTLDLLHALYGRAEIACCTTAER